VLSHQARTINVVRLPRLSPRAYQRITLLAALALAFIIVTGAGVRLTGSGLGCSDWPTCD
jgi:cytochrome c oxidase assembly protein subunit 15